MFGASDEILGAIESGVDFEKRIAAIYQRCRRPEEIQTAFDQLQLELNLEINESISSTRKKLLERRWLSASRPTVSMIPWREAYWPVRIEVAPQI